MVDLSEYLLKHENDVSDLFSVEKGHYNELGYTIVSKNISEILDQKIIKPEK